MPFSALGRVFRFRSPTTIAIFAMLCCCSCYTRWRHTDEFVGSLKCGDNSAEIRKRAAVFRRTRVGVPDSGRPSVVVFHGQTSIRCSLDRDRLIGVQVAWVSSWMRVTFEPGIEVCRKEGQWTAEFAPTPVYFDFEREPLEEPCVATSRQLERQLSAATPSLGYQAFQEQTLHAVRDRGRLCAREIVDWFVNNEELLPDREVVAMFSSLRTELSGTPHAAHVATVMRERPDRLAASEERRAYLHGIASLPAAELASLLRSAPEVERFTSAAIAACEPRRSLACREVAKIEATLSGLEPSSDRALTRESWARLWRVSYWARQ